MSRPWIAQFAWLAAGLALLVTAGLLQDPLQRQVAEHELIPPDVSENHPEVALLTMAPGGLRAPIVNYLWIRANYLKEAGKYYDARQLAGLICALQPHFPSVWDFHAWNMAWNISVATKTPQERWLWIVNGMELLRDKAIPANPKSLLLYRSLAWIWFSKLGGFMDDYNMEYKQRWAAEMQRLLGAPPAGGAAEYIAAFEPIAEAPVDKTLSRQGGSRIQDDQRGILLSDPQVAAYAERLGKLGIGVDETLLGAYNRYSQDESAAVIRVSPAKLRTDHDRAVSAAINDPQYAQARTKMLAFVRAQLLWNVYKMDPSRMLDLMKRHDAPLDWRLPWPHAIYWADLGIEVTGSVSSSEVPVLNTDRIILNSLKQLTWRGRLTLIENRADPDHPYINLTSNWRFIEPTHQQYMRFIHAMQKAKDIKLAQNPIHSGHETYLENAIQVLVALGRDDQAEKYYRFLKDVYHKSGGAYECATAREFVLRRLSEPYESRHTISSVAVTQISIALERAFVQLMRGQTPGYRRSLAYAKQVYETFQKNVAKRLLLPPFERLAGSVLASLLVEPRAVGYNISLEGRVKLYAAVGVVWPRLQLVVYDIIRQPLLAQCRAANADFDRAFPEPYGIEQYRAQMRRELPESPRSAVP